MRTIIDIWEQICKQELWTKVMNKICEKWENKPKKIREEKLKPKFVNVIFEWLLWKKNCKQQMGTTVLISCEQKLGTIVLYKNCEQKLRIKVVNKSCKQMLWKQVMNNSCEHLITINLIYFHSLPFELFLGWWVVVGGGGWWWVDG